MLALLCSEGGQLMLPHMYTMYTEPRYIWLCICTLSRGKVYTQAFTGDPPHAWTMRLIMSLSLDLYIATRGFCYNFEWPLQVLCNPPIQNIINFDMLHTDSACVVQMQLDWTSPSNTHCCGLSRSGMELEQLLSHTTLSHVTNLSIYLYL